MSVTSPESNFYPIADTNGQGGIILWSDGHSVSGESIEEALAAGMKHFQDVSEDGDHFILCSKVAFTQDMARRYLALWDEENERDSDAEQSNAAVGERHKGKLNTPLKAHIGRVSIPYEFKKLEGIPQAGDMEMDVSFKADGAEFIYRHDGRFSEAKREGETIPPEYEIPGLGSVEMVASELVESYLRLIAPTDAVDAWIELDGWKIDKGDLVEDRG